MRTITIINKNGQKLELKNLDQKYWGEDFICGEDNGRVWVALSGALTEILKKHLSNFKVFTGYIDGKRINDFGLSEFNDDMAFWRTGYKKPSHAQLQELFSNSNLEIIYK